MCLKSDKSNQEFCQPPESNTNTQKQGKDGIPS